jgi:uncharacterized protein YgiM (DUF1202 family)
MLVASPRLHGKKFVSGAIVASALALTTGLMSGTFTANAQGTGLSTGQAVVVSTDALNLRTDASSTADVLTVLPQATYATVLEGPVSGDNYSWYLIEIDGTSGYVAADYISDAASTGSFSIGETVYVNTDALNLRDTATSTGSVIAELAAGSVATVIDGPVEADGYAWYQLDVDGTTGWAARDFLAYGVNDAAQVSVDTATSEVVSGDVAYVNTDSLNVRDIAGLDGSIVETVYTGETVTLTGTYETVDGYEWALVQTALDNNGYLASEYLTTDSDSILLSIGGVGYVNTDILNLRDSASTSGTIIAELVTGEEVTVLSASEAADGYLWLQVETSAGTGWVVGEYLSA